MREHDDEDLPILDAVVRVGDEAIILSSRLGRETLAELEALRRAALEPDGVDDGAVESICGSDPAAAHGGVSGTGERAKGHANEHAAGPPHRPGRGDGSAVFLDPDTMRPSLPPTGDRGAAIDVLLERQVDALRRELRELLGGGGGPRHGPPK